ncbi:MAG: MFS transporter [Myxococcales bacterium]|nr:MFS transporter [Myxococcales bacterium]
MPAARATVVAYGVPAFGVMAATTLFYAYFVKYATDVLLVPAGAMGALYLANRVWDAVTDPLVGHLSDGTRSRLGRRRPWIVASVVPLVAFTWAAWAPPESLDGGALVLWVGAAMLGFSTATTLFQVPHNALGAELAADYHGRTRVFASREYFAVVGAALALFLGVGALTRTADPRAAALRVAGALAAAMVVGIAAALPFLRERADYQARPAPRLATALRDIAANPHARTILGMAAVLQMGGGAASVLSPYVVDDVIGAREHTRIVYLTLMTAQLAAIPLWTRVATRLGKKHAWLGAMAVGMIGYAMILFVREGDLVLLCAATVFTASLHAAAIVVGYSVIADVVDWDELRTGERKEASYYAVYHFLFKAASGAMGMIAGFGLQWAGYDPSPEALEQPLVVKRAMTAMLGGIPLACIACGAALFTRYRLSAEEHARIRAALDARAAGPLAAESSR